MTQPEHVPAHTTSLDRAQLLSKKVWFSESFKAFAIGVLANGNVDIPCCSRRGWSRDVRVSASLSFVSAFRL